MSALRKKPAESMIVLRRYDAATDARNRISLRGAKTKYFHVKALSNGGYLLEPRVLVAPEAVSAKALKHLERAVGKTRRTVPAASVDPSKSKED